MSMQFRVAMVFCFLLLSVFVMQKELFSGGEKYKVEMIVNVDKDVIEEGEDEFSLLNGKVVRVHWVKIPRSLNCGFRILPANWPIEDGVGVVTPLHIVADAITVNAPYFDLGMSV